MGVMSFTVESTPVYDRRSDDEWTRVVRSGTRALSGICKENLTGATNSEREEKAEGEGVVV